jgi:hypothetical protein
MKDGLSYIDPETLRRPLPPHTTTLPHLTGGINNMGPEFVVKDSGKRQEFDSGMVRDTSEGKMQYHRCLEGPMFQRWAAHLTKGAVKYPDNPDGSANWTKASGDPELRRFKESALRHFIQWYFGHTDEDHAAGVLFNVNGAEYVKLLRGESGVKHAY